MRILFVTQYYPPETGAAQNRLSDLTHRLSAMGHTITVLTGLPNYPKGEIFENYRGRVLEEEMHAGVRIIRTWLYATKSKKTVPRIINFVSFAIMATVVGSWKSGPQDLVFAETPPLFSGLSGWLLSRWRNAKFLLNVSDLWPESAIALGALRNRPMIGLALRIEEFLYRHADLISGQTKGIVTSIRKRMPDKTIASLPNGVATESLLSLSEIPIVRERIRKELNLTENFVVGYVGLHGMAQGLKTVLECAHLLSHQEDIVFVFFGDGPEKQDLICHMEQLNLGNVRFYPPEEASRMPVVLTAFDVSVVPLRRNWLFSGALPSKLFESMGSGIPVVVAIEGEAKSLVEEAQGGICVEPENPREMADAILQLRQDSALRTSFGQNARQFITERYARGAIAQQFERLLISCLNGHAPA